LLKLKRIISAKISQRNNSQAATAADAD